MDKEETGRIVREIVDQLPAEQRLVTVMFYYQEISVKEIARAVGCSENTVKSRLRYARLSLERKIKTLETNGVILRGILPMPFLIDGLSAATNVFQPSAQISSQLFAHISRETASQTLVVQAAQNTGNIAGAAGKTTGVATGAAGKTTGVATGTAVKTTGAATASAIGTKVITLIVAIVMIATGGIFVADNVLPPETNVFQSGSGPAGVLVKLEKAYNNKDMDAVYKLYEPAVSQMVSEVFGTSVETYFELLNSSTKLKLKKDGEWGKLKLREIRTKQYGDSAIVEFVAEVKFSDGTNDNYACEMEVVKVKGNWYIATPYNL
jgi:AraC-like DNA-binding protein